MRENLYSCIIVVFALFYFLMFNGVFNVVVHWTLSTYLRLDMVTVLCQPHLHSDCLLYYFSDRTYT